MRYERRSFVSGVRADESRIRNALAIEDYEENNGHYDVERFLARRCISAEGSLPAEITTL